MSDCNIDAKFGTPPLYGPLPNANKKVILLLGQFVLCSIILCMLTPSFVTYTRKGGHENLDFQKVCFISIFTVLASVVLDISGASPKDSFMKVFEFLYRTVKG
ncbi:MAG: hypothetical protein CBC12_07135 [Candidatus Puniceispirillum sp. TMED52]|jgi:hypothetical protein|nr:MAG: hypothetical protein CBC12_07135 [Candidatus Puniceispirillum sp. TMED52]